jgi:hypothetical protein
VDNVTLRSSWRAAKLLTRLPERFQTQRITEADIEAGVIRLPHDAKVLFPSTNSQIDVILRGLPLRVSWEPRFDPDQERSGRLRIGRGDLRSRIVEDDHLNVSRDTSGAIRLD